MKPLVVIALVAAGCRASAPATGLEPLDAARVAGLRDAFNRAADHPRVLALFSPT